MDRVLLSIEAKSLGQGLQILNTVFENEKISYKDVLHSAPVNGGTYWILVAGPDKLLEKIRDDINERFSMVLNKIGVLEGRSDRIVNACFGLKQESLLGNLVIVEGTTIFESLEYCSKFLDKFSGHIIEIDAKKNHSPNSVAYLSVKKEFANSEEIKKMAGEYDIEVTFIENPQPRFKEYFVVD